MAAGLATRFTATIVLPLVDEAFTEETRQLGRGVLVIVGVVALTLVGEQGMQHVVAVVVPLRSEAGGQQAGAVVLVFQYQVHVAVGSTLACTRSASSVRKLRSGIACTASKRSPSKR